MSRIRAVFGTWCAKVGHWGDVNVTSSGACYCQVTNGEVVIDPFERCGIKMASLEQPHLYTARRQFNLMLTAEWSGQSLEG